MNDLSKSLLILGLLFTPSVGITIFGVFLNPDTDLRYNITETELDEGQCLTAISHTVKGDPMYYHKIGVEYIHQKIDPDYVIHIINYTNYRECD